MMRLIESACSSIVNTQTDIPTVVKIHDIFAIFEGEILNIL